MSSQDGSLSSGDLVRICTTTEVNLKSEEDIDWCYGLFIKRIREPTKIDPRFHSRHYDIVLSEGKVHSYDEFWHIERLS
jgi:hypothetical protein